MLTTRTDITGFNAKSKTIRMADDLAREVANTFSYPSTSKMLKLKRIPYKKYKDLCIQTTDFRKAMSDNLENSYTDFGKINAAIKTIQERRLANCIELSFLAFIMAKCRGLKGCSMKYLFSSTEALDHSVLYVNGKKPYIIDPWLGFADYVPKAIERYNSEFRKFLGFDKSDYKKNILFMDEMLVCSAQARVVDNFRFNDFPEALLNKLQKHYPEFFTKFKPTQNSPISIMPTEPQVAKQKNIFKLFSGIVQKLFRKENS